MRHIRTRVAWSLLLLPILSWTSTAAEPVLKLELSPANILELVWVKPGSFRMGSPTEEEGRGADENTRQVTLTQPFYLGRTEVTIRQFEQFVRETGYRTEAEEGKSGGFGWDGTKLVQAARFNWRSPGYPITPDHPVSLVTWNDARRFCDWLSRKSKRPISLPTEAQWEYAARAGATEAWSGGAGEVVAWTLSNAGIQAHPVGTKPPNPWGFYDLHGNLWEWCEDWYGPYDPSLVTDPLQTQSNLTDKPRRVLRGGSWLKEPKLSRSAARYRNDPRSRNPDNGFRIAISPADTVSATPASPRAESAPPPQDPTPPPTRSTPAPTLSGSTPPPGPEVSKPEPKPAPDRKSPVKWPVTNPRSGGGWGVWPLMGFIAVAFVVLLARILYRVLRSRLQADPTPAGIRDQAAPPPLFKLTAAPDGFWIQSSLPRGTRFGWSCLVGGSEQNGTIDFIPGPQGQFIFTGSRPTEIKVRTLGGAGGIDASPRQRLSSLLDSDASQLGQAGGLIYELGDQMRSKFDSRRSNPSRRPNPSAYGS